MSLFKTFFILFFLPVVPAAITTVFGMLFQWIFSFGDYDVSESFKQCASFALRIAMLTLYIFMLVFCLVLLGWEPPVL